MPIIIITALYAPNLNPTVHSTCYLRVVYGTIAKLQGKGKPDTQNFILLY